ncbi:MAG TPA: hypothetical protein VNT80_04935, partial [Acidimicrobiales bacterium]|nr:hypothetical protein [Acidimicrobiales bacterium]
MRALHLLGTVAGRAYQFMRRDKKAAAGAIILFVLLVITAFPSWFTPHDPASEIYPSGVGLSWSHLLGTTSLGQDVFSQVMAGTRQSVLIALIVGFLCTIISVTVGITAAYMGGLVDDGLSLLTDV